MSHKKGFVGRSANRYMETVYDTISVLSKGIEGSDEKNNKGDESNHTGKLERNIDNLITKINSSLVYVDDDKYNYLASKSLQIDNNMKDKVNYTIDRLEEMCNVKFVVPQTTEKIKNILLDLRTSMIDFEELSGNSRSEILDFVSLINEIDR